MSQYHVSIPQSKNATNGLYGGALRIVLAGRMEDTNNADHRLLLTFATATQAFTTGYSSIVDGLAFFSYNSDNPFVRTQEFQMDPVAGQSARNGI